jgi:hypothetical protein
LRPCVHVCVKHALKVCACSRKLFQKLALAGVIERRVGERAPTSGLARAELDIKPFRGEHPSRLRVEQQILFADEWKARALSLSLSLYIDIDIDLDR